MSNQSPEQKNGLLALLQNLWLPVTGFAGAVTLVYNFYQSWRGDQAVVTYISGGIGLLFLVIALVWVGWKTYTFERPKIHYLYDKQEIISNQKDELPAYPSFYKAARIALGLVLLGIIIGGVTLFQRRQALQNKLVVLIATFEGPEEVYGLRNEILERLDTDFSNDSEVEIIKISDVITPDQGSVYARKLGERYLADVVLWGWYRPTQNPNITIHIENLSPDQIIPLDVSETLHPTVTLKELESFSFQQKSGQETSALISFLAGFLQYKSQNYSRALLRFNIALEKIQGDVKLLKNQAQFYSYRGDTHLFLDQDDEAIADYSEAIQLDPKLTTSYNDRGVAYANQKKYDLAIIDFSKAIQIDPKSMIFYNRGVAYNANEQYDRAIADFSKAIQIGPQIAKVYAQRGTSYLLLKQFAQAISDFSKAIEIDPKLAAAYSGRGSAYSSQKQYNLDDIAIADYSKAIEIDPQDATSYFNRGSIYLFRKQYELAINDYSKAIQIDPKPGLSYFNRGVVYFQMGKYNQAIDDFSSAIATYPEYSDAYQIRGLVYQKLGKTAEADADFAKYKELGGKSIFEQPSQVPPNPQ